MKCISPHPVLRVPCGRCDACRINYSSMWTQRLVHEKAFHKKSGFVTLTYDDDHLPLPLSVRSDTTWLRRPLVKRDCQLFLKKLRKTVDGKVSYYLAGEYGEKGERPHYHAVMFGLSSEDEKKVADAWGLGFVKVGDVTQASCKYVAGYVEKKVFGKFSNQYYEQRGICKEFSLMSRNPGIGRLHVEKYGKEIAERGFSVVDGKRAPTPRYYLSRLYADLPGFKERREKEVFESARKSCVEMRKEVIALGEKKFDKKVIEIRKQISHNISGRKNLRRKYL